MTKEENIVNTQTNHLNQEGVLPSFKEGKMTTKCF